MRGLRRLGQEFRAESRSQGRAPDFAEFPADVHGYRGSGWWDAPSRGESAHPDSWGRRLQDGAAKQVLPPSPQFAISDRREDRLTGVEQLCLTRIFPKSHGVVPSTMDEETLTPAINERQENSARTWDSSARLLSHVSFLLIP